MYTTSISAGLLAFATASSAMTTANFDGLGSQVVGQKIGVHNGLDWTNFFANSNYFEVTTVLPDTYPNRATHQIREGVDPIGLITVNSNEFKSFDLSALSYGCAVSEAQSGTLNAVACTLEFTGYGGDYGKTTVLGTKQVSFAPGPSLVGGLLLSDMARTSFGPSFKGIQKLEIKVVPAALEGTARYAICLDTVEYELHA